MTMHDDDSVDESDDIYLSAYYLLAGCRMTGKRKVGPKIYFQFKNDAGSLPELRRAFYSGEAVGKLHDFSIKVVGCKQLLFEP